MFGFITKFKENRAIAAEANRIAQEKEEFESKQRFFSDLIELSKEFTYVKFDGTALDITHDSYSDAHIALKELRILKKKAAIKKREITDRYKEIRDDYSQEVGNRDPMVWTVGTGKFGTVMRAGARAGRAAARAQMADVKRNKEIAVAPWDGMIDALDRAIVKMETVKVKYEASK
jgi:hypothetical protein